MISFEILIEGLTWGGGELPILFELLLFGKLV
jgi:hypothetical protein